MKKKKRKSKESFSPEWRNIVFNIAFSIVAILIVILFYEQILLTAILEGILGIIGLIKWKSKVTLSIFILGGIWGALAEMLVIYTSGAWAYKLPSLLNIIPLWLIFVWANAAAYLYETGKELRKIIKKK
jgi:hypothetical protein